MTHCGGIAVEEDRLYSVDTASHCHKGEKTSFHADVPVTALLYDTVNAVYTKMYFLWKL